MNVTVKRHTVAEDIPGYTYGTSDVARAPISLKEFEALKQTVGFTRTDQEYLRMAGEALADQTKALVETWRGVISKAPHLSRHSKDRDGNPIAHYSERSGLRFEQWILDTCWGPYDEDWLNYQQEIALRHTSKKKNVVDGAESTPYIPLRDILAFAAVINETVKSFLARKGHSAEDVERMHSAWCKSVQLQMALWSEPYTDTKLAPDQC
jgi:Protoglobin